MRPGGIKFSSSGFSETASFVQACSIFFAGGLKQCSKVTQIGLKIPFLSRLLVLVKWTIFLLTSREGKDLQNSCLSHVARTIWYSRANMFRTVLFVFFSFCFLPDTDYLKYLFPQFVKSNLYHLCYTSIGQRISICNYWNGETPAQTCV